MDEINWNGGYYRVGGSHFHYGQVRTITKLEVGYEQRGSSVFDRVPVLKITTEGGKVFESIAR